MHKRQRTEGRAQRHEQRWNPFERDPFERAAAEPRAAQSGPAPWGTRFASLSEELRAFAAYVALDAEEEAAREQLVALVREVVAEECAGARVEAFGSWPAGLSAFDGDVDLRVVGGTAPRRGSRGEALLQRLGDALRPRVRSVRVITSARVPIVSLESHSSVQADVSLGSDDGATAVLTGLARAQPAFVPVVLALKLLLSQHALNKVYTGGVSSFRLCVMVARLFEERARSEVVEPSDLLLRALRLYGCQMDWTATDTLSAQIGIAARFDSQTFQIWRVVDAMRGALHALARPNGAGLREVIDASGLRARREASRASLAGSAPAAADRGGGWKAQGDEAMGSQRFELAFGSYTAAMAEPCLHGPSVAGDERQRLAVLLSNRSAAALGLSCPAQAEEDARRSASLRPGWGRPWARLGAALELQQRYGEAADALKRALECEPSNERWQAEYRSLHARETSDDTRDCSSSSSGGREEHKARGNEAFRARRSAEAAGWYTRAIEADGDASSAGEASSNGAEVAVLRSNRSAAFMKLGANSEALAEARRCVKLDASFVKGYLRLGEALGAMGRWGDAIDALEEGLALEPAHAALQSALAQAASHSS